jgi:sterol desaturase/sphingolipid hydroxylase (fatty acid hydroxylase superfamily)
MPTLSSLTPTSAAIAIAGAFIGLALLELCVPDRPAQRRRWWLNLGLGLVNTLIVRVAALGAPIAAAFWATERGWGLFPWAGVTGWAAIALGVILLDLALYWQHRALHSFAWGWAIHKLHHADAAMDISTGVRFHPAEAVVSMLYKAAITILLGLPVVAVLAFQIWIAVGSFFEHANLHLPARADHLIRRFWVTPAMHLVHHSAHGDDHNHNYGFAIAWWDRWFASYRINATGPKIGLPLGARAL